MAGPTSTSSAQRCSTCFRSSDNVAQGRGHPLPILRSHDMPAPSSTTANWQKYKGRLSRQLHETRLFGCRTGSLIPPGSFTRKKEFPVRRSVYSVCLWAILLQDRRGRRRHQAECSSSTRRVIVARELATRLQPQPGPARTRPAHPVQSAPGSLLPAPRWAACKTPCLHGRNGVFWRETAALLKNFGAVPTSTIPCRCSSWPPAAPPMVLHPDGSFVAARGRTRRDYAADRWKFGDPRQRLRHRPARARLALLELQNPPATGAGKLSPLAEALRAHTGLADYSANSRFFYYDAEANKKSPPSPRSSSNSPRRTVGRPSRSWRIPSRSSPSRGRGDPPVFPAAVAGLPCGVSGRILNSVPAVFALRSLASKLQWPVELHFIDTPPIEACGGCSRKYRACLQPISRLPSLARSTSSGPEPVEGKQVFKN